jgi:hypothetical protein
VLQLRFVTNNLRPSIFMRLLACLFVVLFCSLPTQGQTVGVLQRNADRVSDGYRLFAPAAGFVTYLIDNDGYAVRTWTSAYRPGLAAKLLPGGRLLRMGSPNVPKPLDVGGAGGILEEFDWSGKLTWTYELANDSMRLHHDVTALPNGNFLVLAWKYTSISQMVALGRRRETIDNNFVLNEMILEVKPTRPAGGEIVWQWSALDNCVQDADPDASTFGAIDSAWDKIDLHIGQRNQDWLHTNGIDYNPERNEIAISIRNLNEIFIINHSTGRIVYRWGNPRNYGRGIANDQRLWFQHAPRWVRQGRPGFGNITIFSNNVGRNGMPPFTSSVEEITPPLDANGNYIVPEHPFAFEPRTPTWRFDPRQSIAQFYSPNVSGAERLPNGNTLICLGNSGMLYEVTQDSTIVWAYRSPHGMSGPVRQGEMPQNNMFFYCPWYAADGPELAGQTLTPMGRIEDGPLSVLDTPQQRAWVVTEGTLVISEFLDLPRRFSSFDLLGRFLGSIVAQPGLASQRIPLPQGSFIVIQSD